MDSVSDIESEACQPGLRSPIHRREKVTDWIDETDRSRKFGPGLPKRVRRCDELKAYKTYPPGHWEMIGGLKLQY